MPNIHPHSVLYYPTIEFASEDWLKWALLFWDHVYSIVSNDYTPYKPKYENFSVATTLMIAQMVAYCKYYNGINREHEIIQWGEYS